MKLCDLTGTTDLGSIIGPIELSCEVRSHRGKEPAAWIVWQVVCCPASPSHGLACDPCLQRFLNSGKRTRCPRCGAVYPNGRAAIRRYEPLGSA